jgi:hypothetical protein
MKPLEIVDYKTNWKSQGFEVKIHTDKQYDAIRWCKEFCEKEEWNINTFTDVYEDTFQFEKAIHAQAFNREFGL